MTYIRTSIMLDENLAKKLRQEYKNLSKGINIVVKEHLFEEKKESMFGALKGKRLTTAWKELEKEQEQEEKEHEKLYR